MTEELYDILNGYGYPVRLMTYLLETETYPETFIVYDETGTEDLEEYDNNSHAILYKWQVIIFSKNPISNTALAKQLKTDLKAYNYTMQGIGYSISADNGYVGRNLNIQKVERF